MSQKCSPDWPRRSQHGAKQPFLGAFWRLLAATSRQLGLNLAPLGAFWAHLGSTLALPGPAQNGQISFQTQLRAKMAPNRPGGRPQTPPTSIFLRFGAQFFMFFGCGPAARLSKRIVPRGTGDGGASPQGVLDNIFLHAFILGFLYGLAPNITSVDFACLSKRKPCHFFQRTCMGLHLLIEKHSSRCRYFIFQIFHSYGPSDYFSKVAIP